MAQHGYLHDTYDRDDFGRDDDHRERSSRHREDDHSWRSHDDERGGHDRNSEWRDDDRGSMFGWRDRDRHSSDHGYFEDGRNQASPWSGGDRSGSGSDWQRQSSWNSDRNQGAQRYSAHPDDHYRSWRDKQMQALDRDYQDYCREREQQFHSDFDSWRQNRGQQASSQGGSSSETMDLDSPVKQGGEVAGATTSPTGAATLGTNNSENSEPASTNRAGRSR